jgi:hypothetical protein
MTTTTTNIINSNNPNNNNLFQVDSLSSYMFTTKNLTKIVNHGMRYNNHRKACNKPIRTGKQTTLTSESQPQGDTFFPHEHDTLFWCFYIIKHGQDAYESLGKINIVIERKIKIDYIERFREGKQVLKTYKCAPLPHLENVLLNETQIDMKTCIALCVMEGISFMYMYKNTYYDMNIEVDETTHIHSIVKMDLPMRYGSKIVADVQTIRTSFYKIDNLNKPLKSMSAYKLEELVVFCDKLGLTMKTDGKKVSKKNLYEMLVQYFSL